MGCTDPGHQDLGHLPGTLLMHLQIMSQLPVHPKTLCTKLLCSMTAYFTFTC